MSSQENSSIDQKKYDSLKKLMGNAFSDFLESYVTSIGSYIQEGQEALDNDDLMAVKNNVHPIISTSQSLGAVQLAQTARSVEDLILGDNGVDSNRSDIAVLYEQLASQFSDVKAVISQELE